MSGAKHADNQKITGKIENIVASANLGENLDLEVLQKKYRDVIKKDNFPGVIIRISQPKATLLAFSSGNIILTGVKKMEHIPILTEKVIRKFKRSGLHINQIPSLTVQNIVASGDFHFRFNLDKIFFSLDNSMYEPEVFPGLFYKMTDPKICFIIFSSGRIIITGAKSEKELWNSVKKFANKLKEKKIFEFSPDNYFL